MTKHRSNSLLKKTHIGEPCATAGLSSSASISPEFTAGQASSGTRLFQQATNMLVPRNHLAVVVRAHCAMLAIAMLLCVAPPIFASETFSEAIANTQPKVVKIYGAGGYRGLEPYQSGMLVSSEGHVLTVWSYVLDTDYITVTLNDGRRFEAKLVGADPRLEMAVLKIDAEDLPHFKLSAAVEATAGARVLAFSNLYGVATGNEPASVQHGSIAVVTNLEARHGAFETPYHGPVHVLDAMTNNPGAAGGVLTNRRGELLGMLGKELRNSLNNTWLNYAIPMSALAPTAKQIILGQYEGSVSDAPRDQRSDYPLTLDLLGIVLVPNVLERTPPFIDRVRRMSPANAAGVRPDDLLIFVNGRLVQSCNALLDELTYIDRADEVQISVMRDGQFLEFSMRAVANDVEGGR